MALYYYLLRNTSVEAGKEHSTTSSASGRPGGSGSSAGCTFGSSSLGSEGFLGARCAGGLGRLTLELAGNAEGRSGAASTRTFGASRAGSTSLGTKLVCVVSSGAAFASSGSRSRVFALGADGARALAASGEGSSGAGTATVRPSNRVVLTSSAQTA